MIRYKLEDEERHENKTERSKAIQTKSVKESTPFREPMETYIIFRLWREFWFQLLLLLPSTLFEVGIGNCDCLLHHANQ